MILENESVPKAMIEYNERGWFIEIPDISGTVYHKSFPGMVRDLYPDLTEIINGYSCKFFFSLDGSFIELLEFLKISWKSEHNNIQAKLWGMDETELHTFLSICQKHLPKFDFLHRNELEFLVFTFLEDEIYGNVVSYSDKSSIGEEEEFLAIPLEQIQNVHYSNFKLLYGHLESVCFHLKNYVDAIIAHTKVFYSPQGSIPINEYNSRYQGDTEKLKEMCCLYGLTEKQVEMLYKYSAFREISVLDYYLPLCRSFNLILAEYHNNDKYLNWDYRPEDIEDESMAFSFGCGA